jgi:uncharacterized membrane protein YhaH (DUF805 family)
MAGNPYAPPGAAVGDIAAAGQEFQPIGMWSAAGRIGRLRYLAYSTAASLLMGFWSVAASALLGPDLGAIAILLGYIPVLIFVVLALIQRSHDMDWSGWTVLLALIPFVALIWMFKSGTAGRNNYGAPPPPNTLGVKILGIIAPAIFFAGLLAAIALPAYQDYVKRAQAIQQGR